jgi:hypothetical protein
MSLRHLQRWARLSKCGSVDAVQRTTGPISYRAMNTTLRGHQGPAQRNRQRAQYTTGKVMALTTAHPASEGSAIPDVAPQREEGRSRLRLTATHYRTSVAHSAAPESAVANPRVGSGNWALLGSRSRSSAGAGGGGWSVEDRKACTPLSYFPSCSTSTGQ